MDAPRAGGGDTGRGMAGRVEVELEAKKSSLRGFVDVDAVRSDRRISSRPASFDEDALDRCTAGSVVDAAIFCRLAVVGESASGVKARAAARTDGLRRAIFRSDGGGGGGRSIVGSSSGGVSEEFGRGIIDDLYTIAMSAEIWQSRTHASRLMA